MFAKAGKEDSPKAATESSGTSVRSEAEEASAPAEFFEAQYAYCCEQTAKTAPGGPAASEPQPGEDYGKGIIFYMRGKQIVGIVLWNVFNRMAIARKVHLRFKLMHVSRRGK